MKLYTVDCCRVFTKICEQLSCCQIPKLRQKQTKIFLYNELITHDMNNNQLLYFYENKVHYSLKHNSFLHRMLTDTFIPPYNFRICYFHVFLTLTRPSSPADASHRPSGLNLKQFTDSVWPCIRKNYMQVSKGFKQYA